MKPDTPEPTATLRSADARLKTRTSPSGETEQALETHPDSTGLVLREPLTRREPMAFDADRGRSTLSSVETPPAHRLRSLGETVLARVVPQPRPAVPSPQVQPTTTPTFPAVSPAHPARPSSALLPLIQRTPVSSAGAVAPAAGAEAPTPGLLPTPERRPPAAAAADRPRATGESDSTPTISATAMAAALEAADIVQRQPTIEPRPAETPAARVQRTPSISSESTGSAGPDLDELARDVYPLIKRMLAIERERRPKR